MRFSDSINTIVAWLAIVVVFFINTIQSASYNGNNQPYILAQADTMAVFDYDSDWNRTIMTVYKNADVEDYVDENGNITSRPANALYDRVYIGNRYEVYLNRMLPPTHIYYIGGDPASAVAVATYSMGVMRSRNFIYRDHQGSITELVDTLGNVTSFYYDPWGRPCDSSGTPYANGYRPTASWFIRGYLSQEYYAKFRLINLNARLYNPHIGRFLSIDPVWNTSADVFGFNPYIYGNNNPCWYVDPDGKFAWTLVAAMAIIGGGINLAMHYDQVDNFWQGLGYFAAGAAIGGFSAAFAAPAVGFCQGAAVGSLTGGASGFMLGGLNSAIGGKNFWDGAREGGVSGMIIGSITGGISGAFNAQSLGRNWFTGSKQVSVPQFESTTTYFEATEDFGNMTPNEKGALGVSADMGRNGAINGYNAQTEVSFKFSMGTDAYGNPIYKTYRADYTMIKDGELHLYEVKTGTSTTLTPNQKLLFQRMQQGPVPLTPYGGNAIKFQNIATPNGVYFKLNTPIVDYHFHFTHYIPR